MGKSNPRDTLQSAFQEFFAFNSVGNGSRSYYGVLVSDVRKSAAETEIDLTLTFRSENRYCCFEDGCHHWFFKKESWARFRRLLKKRGWVDLTPLKIAILRGRVEKGARASYGGLLDRSQELVRETYQYRAGPYSEREAKA